MCDFTLTECTRQNTCYDCDDEKCRRKGDKGQDCPKYTCDNPKGLYNCDHCRFINKFIKDMRKGYAEGSEDD